MGKSYVPFLKKMLMGGTRAPVGTTIGFSDLIKERRIELHVNVGLFNGAGNVFQISLITPGSELFGCDNCIVLILLILNTSNNLLYVPCLVAISVDASKYEIKSLTNVG